MERIGEYSVVRLVGEGGMGRVYEAEERLTKRRVALKVLRPELVKDEAGRRMFQSEMQILASLEHPNVVRSLAALEHEGQLVLVLEYLEGKTLRALLNDGPISWAKAVDIAAQIASALAAAHGQSTPGVCAVPPSADPATPIIHRDLKPENVMVLEGGATKVMDFGIAKVLEHAQGKSTQSLGTLQYMSPEQIDAGPIDGRTDLYALGLLLYEMLAGAPPFRSASPRELLNLQCTAEPPPFGDDVEAPAGVCDLVYALLAKSPEERPQSAEDVLAALAPFRVAGFAKKRDGASVDVGTKRPSSDRASTSDARTPTKTLQSAKRIDTVALLEKVSAPREIRARTALVAILLASLLSGGTTYGFRAHLARAKWSAADTAAGARAVPPAADPASGARAVPPAADPAAR